MPKTWKMIIRSMLVGGLAVTTWSLIPLDHGSQGGDGSAVAAQRGGRGGGGGGGGGGRGGGGGGGGNRGGGGGGGGGGNRGGGGGGGGANRGGGNVQRGGGNVQRGGGNVQRGGGNVQRGAPHPGAGRSPSFNRTPAFSQPRVNRSAPRVNTPNRGNVNVRVPGANRIGNQLERDVNRAGNQIQRDANRIGNQAERNANRIGNQVERNTNRIGNQATRDAGRIRNQATRDAGRIVNQANRTANRAVNNTLRLGNRNVNLGPRNYRPSFARHRFYHGHWNNNYFGRRNWGWGGGNRWGWGGSRGWGNNRWGWGGRRFGYGFGLGFGLGYGFRPLGWGYGGWGLGRFAYNSGYLGYANPYWGNGYDGYNYAQPIPVAYADAPVEEGVADPSAELLDSAVAAFKANDYAQALDIINRGVTQFPGDSVMHEFRALVLFARQDYQQAAATIHAVLAVGPGWDWTTLSSLYTDVEIYTQQLRALEAFTRSNPQDSGSRFLLAYHYLSDGYPDAAARQLQKVVELVPNDRVAGDLLKMLTSEEQLAQAEEAGETNIAQAQQLPTPAAAPAGTPAVDPAAPDAVPEEPAPTPIDAARLVGSWKASREDGSIFELTLTNDQKFTWKFTPKGQKPDEFSGTYTVEEDILALESPEAGALVAEVKQDGDSKFNFKLAGGPPEDKGLDFSK